MGTSPPGFSAFLPSQVILREPGERITVRPSWSGPSVSARVASLRCSIPAEVEISVADSIILNSSRTNLRLERAIRDRQASGMHFGMPENRLNRLQGQALAHSRRRSTDAKMDN